MFEVGSSEKKSTPVIDFEFIGGVTIEDFSKTRVIRWLRSIAAEENKQIDTLCYHFCDDAYLLELNRKYLQHDTLTDIITFPYSYDPIQSDIYISIERVNENATLFAHNDPQHEFLRVVSHGLLHLCGYNDKSAEEESKMRRLESHYIGLYFKEI